MLQDSRSVPGIMPLMCLESLDMGLALKSCEKQAQLCSIKLGTVLNSELRRLNHSTTDLLPNTQMDKTKCSQSNIV